MLYAVKKTRKYLEEILDNLRIEDESEMLFEFGENWKTIVLESALNSDVEVMVDSENNPIGFYGIREINKNTAEVCLLVSDKLRKNHMSFLLGAKKVITKWQRKYYKLQNYVYKHNLSAIRWLKWLGFTLEVADENRMFFYKVRK